MMLWSSADKLSRRSSVVVSLPGHAGASHRWAWPLAKQGAQVHDCRGFLPTSSLQPGVVCRQTELVLLHQIIKPLRIWI